MKYYFLNYNVVVQSWIKYTHMTILSTHESFFPILKAKNRLKLIFDKEIGENTNIIINNFQEVIKECFYEFHNNELSVFTETL